MIKRIFFSFLLIFFSFSANAESCQIEGAKDFTIEFDFYDVDDPTPGSHLMEHVQVLIGKGEHETLYFWNTEGYQHWIDSYFKEKKPSSGEPSSRKNFNAKIEYAAEARELTYYRKKAGASSWEHNETFYKKVSITNGIYTIEGKAFPYDGFPMVGAPSAYPDGISNLNCIQEKPQKPRENAIYEFGVKQCAGGADAECTIEFRKKYEIQPLVFVMPTVEASDEEAPATLSVTSVNMHSATIRQQVSDTTYNSAGYTSEPMQKISYLVIEPGTADFDGKKVVAGYVETAKFRSYRGFEQTGGTTVFFDDFGLSSISDPVVLSQVQSSNNGGKWMTAGVEDVRKKSFTAFLELSWNRQAGDYKKEKIGFLAAPVSHGEIEGVKFSFDYSVVPSSLENPFEPITYPCEQYTDIAFPVAGIVANKQQRIGGHGGWLRRCNINGQQVSFIIDEDHTGLEDRVHTGEPIGYFAFEDSSASGLDYCEYFPQPAQSWESDTKLKLENHKNGNVDYPYHIGGWSQKYIDQYLSGHELSIGFDKIEGSGAEDELNCEVGQCATGGVKVNQPPEINPNFASDKSLNLENWNYEAECPANDSGEYCRSATDSDGNIVITIKSDLNTLKAQGASANRKMIINFEAGSGMHGRVIGKYETSNHVITRFVNPGIYTFNTMRFNTKTELETGRGIVWQITDKIEFENEVSYTNTGITDDFVIYAPNNGTQVIIKNIKHPIYGLILADKVEFSNPFELHGALTSNDVLMTHKNSTIVGESQCFDAGQPPAEDLYLEITEEKAFALLCENPEFTFTVRDAGDSNKVDTDYSGKIEVTLPDGIDVEQVVKGSGSNGSYTPDNGILILRLKASYYGTYNIKGWLSTDSAQTDTSQLYVAPYKFDSDTVSAIAGHDTAFSLTVLACDDGNAEKVSGYDGSKALTLSDFTLEQPTSAQGGIAGNLTVAGTSSSSVDIKFNNGVAGDVLNYSESGAISFMLTDPTFQCPVGFDCETDEGKWDSLQGIVNVNARPWTFAICEPDGHNMDGTASGGSGFVAAGESFSLNVLPIRYQSGGSLSGDITVGQSYCNTDYVTKNFFNPYSPQAYIALKGELATPTGGESGEAPLVSEGFTKANTEETDNRYLYTGLYWDEVGSLNIGAQTQADYFDMEINRGVRQVGRFYPAYLALTEEAWSYADGHHEFAYMDQPVGHSFVVEAMSSYGEPVANYAGFTDSLIADIQYYAVNGASDNDLTEDRLLGKDQNGNSILQLWSGALAGGQSGWQVNRESGEAKSQLIIDSQDITFVKYAVSHTPYTTEPDGPYDGDNSEFGLKLTDNTEDNVSFSSDRNMPVNIALFDNQPDFRYGRMTLSDVGGNSGHKIKIPLTTEYWNESEFITNFEDSGSEFDVSDYCREILWQDGSAASDAAFSAVTDDSVVSLGKFSHLIAAHSGNMREQVRLWLRQQNEEADGLASSDCYENGEVINQPWLRYNWRNFGDEDPSTVVVFGIFRGNDRVIFRGETRLIKQ